MIQSRTTFLEYLQNIKEPKTTTVRKAALDYLKVAHPNKNLEKNSQTMNNTRMQSLQNLDGITVEQFLRTNVDKIGGLETIVRKINILSKEGGQTCGSFS